MPTDTHGLLRLGAADITEALVVIEQLPEARWHEHPMRQQRFRAHEATQSVLLRYHWQGISVIDDELLGALAPLLDDVRAIVVGHAGTPRVAVGNTLLARLPAGEAIRRHTDQGPYLAAVRRVHVPLAVNERCSFTVDEVEYEPRAGDVYLLDNMRSHAAANRGDTDRIHLICDWLVDGERVTTTGRGC